MSLLFLFHCSTWSFSFLKKRQLATHDSKQVQDGWSHDLRRSASGLISQCKTRDIRECTRHLWKIGHHRSKSAMGDVGHAVSTCDGRHADSTHSRDSHYQRSTARNCWLGACKGAEFCPRPLWPRHQPFPRHVTIHNPSSLPLHCKRDARRVHPCRRQQPQFRIRIHGCSFRHWAADREIQSLLSRPWIRWSSTRNNCYQQQRTRIWGNFYCHIRASRSWSTQCSCLASVRTSIHHPHFLTEPKDAGTRINTTRCSSNKKINNCKSCSWKWYKTKWVHCNCYSTAECNSSSIGVVLVDGDQSRQSKSFLVDTYWLG